MTYESIRDKQKKGREQDSIVWHCTKCDECDIARNTLTGLNAMFVLARAHQRETQHPSLVVMNSDL